MGPSTPDELVAHLKTLRVRRKVRKGDPTVRGRTRRRLADLERLEVLAKTAGLCHICGGPVDGEVWNADHVLAHSGGGAHDVSNFLAAHGVCNSYRWDYVPEEFQLILKLGVWARTQVERQTSIGRSIAAGFTAKERGREKRRRGGQGS